MDQIHPPTAVGSNDLLGQQPERDGAGPRGTYGCACVSDSARMCTLLRYGRDIDSHEQHDDNCECLCHDWRDDDEY